MHRCHKRKKSTISAHRPANMAEFSLLTVTLLTVLAIGATQHADEEWTVSVGGETLRDAER